MASDMLKALRAEAKALAELHPGRPDWSINPDAGTVTELPDGGLVAFLHPAAIDNAQLAGWWYFPHGNACT